MSITKTEPNATRRTELLPFLQKIVARKNYLTREDMVEVAETLHIPIAEVYGTASFFSFLETDKSLGKYVIRVCKTIVCDMHGKNEILETLECCLNIKVGETTKDKMFSLLTTNCLGWCHKAPAMLINDNVYTELTPDKVR
ncbi:MAG: NAD(P)H-dependent oxidoreductase subunit E, partial [Candidatus Zixiibacteriota bacterium]